MPHWLKTTLLNMRAALTTVRPPPSQRTVEKVIQTAALKGVHDTPKHANSTGPTMSPEEQKLAWQKLLEEPSNHQRLAPYA